MHRNPEDSNNAHTNTLHIFPFSVQNTVTLGDVARFRENFPLSEPQRADRALPRVIGDAAVKSDSWPVIHGTTTFRGRGMVAQEVLTNTDVYLVHCTHANPWGKAFSNTQAQSHRTKTNDRHVGLTIPMDTCDDGKNFVQPKKIVSWQPDDALFSGMHDMNAEIDSFAACMDAMHTELR